MICGIVIFAVAAGTLSMFVGFCIWFFMYAIPKFMLNIIRIVAIIIVIGIIVVGFYGAYQIVDDYRHNR